MSAMVSFKTVSSAQEGSVMRQAPSGRPFSLFHLQGRLEHTVLRGRPYFSVHAVSTYNVSSISDTNR